MQFTHNLSACVSVGEKAPIAYLVDDAGEVGPIAESADGLDSLSPFKVGQIVERSFGPFHLLSTFARAEVVVRQPKQTGLAEMAGVRKLGSVPDYVCHPPGELSAPKCGSFTVPPGSVGWGYYSGRWPTDAPCRCACRCAGAFQPSTNTCQNLFNPAVKWVGRPKGRDGKSSSAWGCQDKDQGTAWWWGGS